jgi:hypothetical protein
MCLCATERPEPAFSAFLTRRSSCKSGKILKVLAVADYLTDRWLQLIHRAIAAVWVRSGIVPAWKKDGYRELRLRMEVSVLLQDVLLMLRNPQHKTTGQ